MKYNKEVKLKNGITCTLRSATEDDADNLLKCFEITHNETDFNLTYSDEAMSLEQEREYIKSRYESESEVVIIAIIDGSIIGSAGIGSIGTKHKIRHRAEFGISIMSKYWGLGLGLLMTKACIDCAKNGGYTQLELEVVSENETAINLYKKCGFAEYGRNPRGFYSRISGYQELVSMRLEL